VAREYGLPCLVGVKNVKKHLKTGKVINIDEFEVENRRFFFLLISGDVVILDSEKGFVMKEAVIN